MTEDQGAPGGGRQRAAKLVGPEADTDETLLPGMPSTPEPPVPIQYSLAYLDYTMRTNQTNEVRLTKILTVALGGLAASGVLLESVLSAEGTYGHVRTLLFAASVITALLFILAIYRIIRGISPTIGDTESHFLTDHVIQHGTWERFVDSVKRHDGKEAAAAVWRENFAMAGVVNARQQIYKRAAVFVYWGGGVLMVTYLAQVLARFFVNA